MEAIDLTVHIHPVALFTIVGGHERRPDTEARRDAPKTPQKRIIGTVLGSRERNILEVKTAFTVPHNETTDEVQVDMEFAQGMFELHRKVKQSDVILGWFATGLEITEHSKLIHDYYNRISDGPAIHVTVDTTLKNGRMDINCYIGSRVGVPGKSDGVIFTPVKTEIVSFAPELVGVKYLQLTKQSDAQSVEIMKDLNHIEIASTQMEQHLTEIITYVEDVIAGKIPADSQVGRSLMQIVSTVPEIEPAKFESLINSGMQDLLMIVYLANLTKTHLALGEKLSKIVT